MDDFVFVFHGGDRVSICVAFFVSRFSFHLVSQADQAGFSPTHPSKDDPLSREHPTLAAAAGPKVCSSCLDLCAEIPIGYWLHYCCRGGVFFLIQVVLWTTREARRSIYSGQKRIALCRV